MPYSNFKDEVNLEFIRMNYPDVNIRLIKFKPSNRYLGDYYRNGYGYCTFDRFVIKTDERACRICGRMFRRSTVNRNNKWVYSQSMKEPQEIILK